MFTFLNLFAFSLVAAVPLLVLAYLKRKSIRTQTVSSVILLQQLKRKQTLKRRVKLPLRFFLEVLALLLLATAAAKPFSKPSDLKIAILVDNTLSMAAKTKSSSRLEDALTATQNLLQRQGPNSSYSLFVSSPQLRQIGKSTVSENAIAKELVSLSVTPTSDSLASATSELLHSGKYDRVWVATDKTLERSSLKPEVSANLEILSVGDSASNLFVSGFRLTGISSSNQTPSLTAGISNSGSTAATAMVNFSSISGSKETLLGSDSIEVTPERVSEVILPLRQISSSSIFKVAIDSSSSSADSLTADNTAWLTSQKSGGTEVLVVSPAASGEQAGDSLGLKSISLLEPQLMSPADYSVLNQKELERYLFVIFHRTAPRSLPALPAFFILPPNTRDLISVKKEIDKPRISSWSQTSPLTSYLRVPLLDSGKAVVFDIPRWAESIINSESGSLVLAGELDGKRIVVSGIELLPFEGAKTPAPSVLFLNIVNWLSTSSSTGPGGALASQILTGTQLMVDADSVRSVRDPQGKTRRIERSTDDRPSVVFDLPGIYELLDAEDRITRRVAANSFYPDESSTNVKGTFELAESINDQGVAATRLEPNWNMFLIAALCIVCLELLLLFILKEPNGTPAPNQQLKEAQGKEAREASFKEAA